MSLAQKLSNCPRQGRLLQVLLYQQHQAKSVIEQDNRNFLTPFLAAGFFAPMVDFLGWLFICSAAAVGDMDSAASTLGPWPLSEAASAPLMAIEL